MVKNPAKMSKADEQRAKIQQLSQKEYFHILANLLNTISQQLANLIQISDVQTHMIFHTLEQADRVKFERQPEELANGPNDLDENDDKFDDGPVEVFDNVPEYVSPDGS